MEIREYRSMYEVENNHFWYKGMRKIIGTLLNRYLPKNQPLKILDAGCGTGRNIIFLKKYGKVSGFDISPHAIKYCKKRKLTNIRLGSINKIASKNNSFDLVTCFDVLYHMQANYKKAIDEFYRILKPGGTLLVRVAAYQWLMSYHDKTIHTKHRFTKTELKKLLLKNKFKVIKATYANCLLLPFIILKRFLLKTTGSDVKPINSLINEIFYVPFIIESFLIKYFDLPFGLSVIIVAKK